MMYTHKKDQRGIAHLLIIVLALLAIAAIGYAAWGVGNHNKLTSSTTAPKTTPTNSISLAAACNRAVSDTTLCQFAAHYNPSAPYKAVDTSTTTEGNGTLTILSDGKGNSSVISTANGVGISFVVLNGATYVKDTSSGTWIKYPASTSSPSTNNPVDSLKINASDITGHGSLSYNKLGTETCGSSTCYKYQVVDSTEPGDTQYLWFGASDYQLHEYYVKNANGTNDLSFSYQTVNITAPSPAKDFSASGQ